MDFLGAVKGATEWLDDKFDSGGYVRGPPLTQTATSHAITIKTARGLKIGRIQNWGPNMARTIDSVFEVQANSTGEPRERVPQIQTGNSISIQRYELYLWHMGEAFGVPVMGASTDLVSLTQQIKGFHVREVWLDPSGYMRAYLYANCWFSNLGQTIAATDDRIIKANATLEFTRKLKLM